jgi:ABC-type branched-subunit amino acid transport system substrate-binding protein
MISAQSLPQPLNGNNISSVLFVVLFGAFFACSSGKTVMSISGSNRSDLSAKSRILREPLDTLPIFPVETEQSLPIGSDKVSEELPAAKLQMKRLNISNFDYLKIGFVLPFLTDKISSPANPDAYNTVSRWAIHYYSGAKLALENWKNKGIKFESSVWDSGADTVDLIRDVVSNPRFQEIPILIGPYHRDNIRYLANYAKNKKVLLFSPFSAAQNLTENNPFFYQVNPQLETQISCIVEHIRMNSAMEHVLILQKDTDERLQNLFLQAFADKSMDHAKADLPKSLLLPTNSDSWINSLNPEMSKRAQLVVVISTYTDEAFLNKLLQELKKETFDKKEILIYGLSPWLHLQGIDFQLLESLNFHVTSPYFIDELNPDILLFQRRFFQELGTLPEPEAYQGYDLVNYLFENWVENSVQFQEKLELGPSTRFLSAPFQFKKINARVFDMDQWQYNMNQNMMLLKFIDFKWQKY